MCSATLYICKKIGVNLNNEHWYKHTPKLVETSPEIRVKILWNQQVQTGLTIPNNELDIIICDNEKGTWMLLDDVMSGDRNVMKKEAENIIKYEDLQEKYSRHRMNAKTKVIPVIIGSSGTTSKSFRKYLSSILGKCGIKKIQKTAILGTAHLFWTALKKYRKQPHRHCTHILDSTNVKVQKFNMVNSSTCAIKIPPLTCLLSKWYMYGTYNLDKSNKA